MHRYRPIRSGEGHANRSMPSSALGHSICGTSYCPAPRGDLTDCCALDDPVSLVCATSPGASRFPAFALDEPVGDEEPLVAATAGPDTDEGPALDSRRSSSPGLLHHRAWRMADEDGPMIRAASQPLHSHNRAPRSIKQRRMARVSVQQTTAHCHKTRGENSGRDRWSNDTTEVGYRNRSVTNYSTQKRGTSVKNFFLLASLSSRVRCSRLFTCDPSISAPVVMVRSSNGTAEW